MSDDLTREINVSLDQSVSEAIQTAVKSVKEDFPVAEIIGAKAWRYRDRWEVRVVADIGVKDE